LRCNTCAVWIRTKQDESNNSLASICQSHQPDRRYYFIFVFFHEHGPTFVLFSGFSHNVYRMDQVCFFRVEQHCPDLGAGDEMEGNIVQNMCLQTSQCVLLVANVLNFFFIEFIKYNILLCRVSKIHICRTTFNLYNIVNSI